jgi:2-methylisocitrate lyase-like PEP mutase family enzyme
MIPQYDIFSGEPGKGNAMWLEAVASLDIACDRLKALSSTKPGKYFVFCARTREIMSAIDTSERVFKKSA